MSKRMQYWSDHLAAIAGEGVPTAAYARREGLSACALYYWRKRLKHVALGTAIATSKAPRAGGQFVPVQVSDIFQPERCSLSVAPGVRLELAQLPTPEWLATLARAVARQVR